MDIDQCHLLTSDFTYRTMWAKLGNVIRWEISDVKLFGVTINKNLGFDEYVSKSRSKYNRSLSALSLCRESFPWKKRRKTFKAFIESF